MDVHQDQSTDDENNTNVTDTDEWFSEQKWASVKNIYHEYLLTFPKRLKQDKKIEIELPYPIYSSNMDFNIDNSWKPFDIPDKTDTRLDYCRKLYTQSKDKFLIKDLRRNVVSIPNYVIDVAVNSIGKQSEEFWYYTGGLLDCLDIDKLSYLFYVSSPENITCVNLNEQNHVSDIDLNDDLPIYNIKCGVNKTNPLLGVRQQSKVSVFESVTQKDKTKCSWSKTSNNSFIDFEFDKSSYEKICTLDSEHNLTFEDIKSNEIILEHSFLTSDVKLIDHLANILFLDANSLLFIDRCSVHLFDIRSKCVKTKRLSVGLECNHLCTLSQKNCNSLYITSMHNILDFDLNMMDCSSTITHLMSTPAFVSSLAESTGGWYLSLMSQTDEVLMHSTDHLSLPQYIPKITDTLRSTSCSTKLDNLDIMDGRLTFSTIGMKLHVDPVTNDICILTCNSGGDVFKQRILRDDSTLIDPIKVLASWSSKLSSKKRKLEATGICNLNKVYHCVTTKFPNDTYVKYLIKEGTGEEFLQKNISSIEKDVKSKVGEIMDAVWQEDGVTKSQEGDVSSQSKVMQWLQFNV